MILQCPACYARFMVPDAAIPPEGRTVKCGKCAHQWQVEGTLPKETPPAPDFAALTEAAMQEEAPLAELGPPRHPLPVVKKRFALPTLPLLPFKVAVPVLALAWAILALYAYFPQGQNAPVVKAFYGMLGVTNTEGLVFSDVQMERENLGPRTRFILGGSVANHAAVARLLPHVRVQLKDNDGAVVWSRTYDVQQAVKPGEVYPFRIEDVETAFASRAASIVLDLGNNFELVMR